MTWNMNINLNRTIKTILRFQWHETNRRPNTEHRETQLTHEGNTADTNEPDTTGRVKLNTLNMQTSDPSK